MSDHLAEIARAACARHDNAPDALIEVLHDVQGALGHIPREAVSEIADALNLSRADVHGVVTFYHDFRISPPGALVVKLCRAEACQARDCETIVAEVETRCDVRWGDTSADGAVSLENVYCLGNCALGPAALIDGELFGRVSADRVETLVKAAQRGKP